MNPSLKLALLVLIALEVSFIQVWSINVALIVVSLILMLLGRITWRRLLWLTLVPLFFSSALVWSLMLRSSASTHFLIVIFTRLFVYVYMGGWFTLTTPPLWLTHSLEQNAKLPSKFAYGFLAAFNLMPKIQAEVATVRAAALMRGEVLHVWSPRLYFKVILAAMNWSDQLAAAMTSHGFVEGAPRTHAQTVPLVARDWWLFVGSLLLVQIGLFVGLP
ncbi:energy-coupling factor transporter transmembrane component T family protein [Levilactobacillus tujiorum]|uniref:Energy-coupling factor transporter transmembrane protein EcfT n=1 Tax=Levilactobacillus tujiorum TaxID=2912243 RepID=A0ABX1L801_9LACO|nr:energy-coupling factor transporter transmembrane component T [Levilactobacillus tujiorum]MCH5465406.1 energy-coupling factor transporter transmembrane protein EcfT [Levilactobacillus tujiorum]NLR12347.1 energy-coupling factor transporter transmembrane protein EcfT [Lactobacillus sp. HBUAS51387]NLR30409.1 energy-coupling factor transporter transmembrane protein EcfT [Levilactobacillus tujiorum]